MRSSHATVPFFLAFLPLLFLPTACGDGAPETEAAADVAADTASATDSAGAPGVVRVTATGLEFDAPDSIPSGWTTFRLSNRSGMTHFAVLERMPEGVGIAEQQAQVAPVFQEGMNLLAAGDVDAAMAKFGELPEWFGEVVFLGGPGLTAPGRSAEATVELEPGTYLLECYVKTDGVFHSYDPGGGYGMVHEITVTGEPSGAPAPTPTLEMTLSAGGGIELDREEVAPGTHTVAVRFADQAAHENFVGHDVHLVRLEDGTDLDSLAAWMDWTRPGGLETPAPAEFLGGLNEMPAGETGYVRVRLEPGRYAWISEVPDPAGKGMLRTFTVGSADGPDEPDGRDG